MDPPHLSWTEAIKDCPVFCPSKQEFDDPFDYIRTIAPEAYKYGICKIVSPVHPSVLASDVLTEDFKFKTIAQPLKDNGKVFKTGREYLYAEFEKMANKSFGQRFLGGSPSAVHLEKRFWNEMLSGTKRSVKYGANIEGSAFSSDPDDELGMSKWNLKNISGLANSTLRFLEKSIPGISDPMLYIGMIFSFFAWHVEDHYLYSINYHHSGAAKTWYGVPGGDAHRLERSVMKRCKLQTVDEAFRLLWGKTTMFSPETLLKDRVPVYKATQMPGEFIVTFPKAYHAGFSHGFNCGEALNFAMRDWFPFGEEANQRYALIGVSPVVPYEELVCKEAMCLYESHNNERSWLSIKRSLLKIVKSYEKLVLSKLCPEPPRAMGSVFASCKICSRYCFLACMICSSCSSSAVCLNNHGSQRIACSCGSKSWELVEREDVSVYKDAARAFERENVRVRKKRSRSYVNFKHSGWQSFNEATNMVNLEDIARVSNQAPFPASTSTPMESTGAQAPVSPPASNGAAIPASSQATTLRTTLDHIESFSIKRLQDEVTDVAQGLLDVKTQVRDVQNYLSYLHALNVEHKRKNCSRRAKKARRS